LIFLIIIILCFIYQYIYIDKSNIENFNSCIINTCKTGYTKSANNLSCIISNSSETNTNTNNSETVVKNTEIVAISSITDPLKTDTIYSQNKRYYIKFINDGDLVLFDTKSSGVIWHTDTSNTGSTKAYILQNGDFIVGYGGINTWTSKSTQSEKNGPFELIIQNDGNLVLYNKVEAIWSSGTNGNSKVITSKDISCKSGYTKSNDNLSCIISEKDEIISKTIIMTTEPVYSQNNRYYIKLINNGDLVLVDTTKSPGTIWHTDTSNTNSTNVSILSNGKFIVGDNKWISNSSSKDAPFNLVIQNDGNLVLYDKFKAIWSSGTNSNSQVITSINTCGGGYTINNQSKCVKCNLSGVKTYTSDGCVIDKCINGYTYKNGNSCVLSDTYDFSNPVSTTSTDGHCGPYYGNKKCPLGSCCSPSGYCGGSIGTQSDYCSETNGTGSMNMNGYSDATAFGLNNGKYDGNLITYTQISTDGKCGPLNNNTICTTNSCCSG